MTINSKTTKIPFSIEKHDFVALLHPVPINTVITRINIIIYDRRKDLPDCKDKTPRQIKGTRYIERPEYIEYFETYGYPDGLEF